MSKLYERYLELKKQDSSILYLFKSGIFYIFLDEDAKKMSYILNLKLSNLNESILKCGFPVNNLSKYSSLIKSAGYQINIIDSVTQKPHSSSEYILNDDIKNFIQKLSQMDCNNLSIREAYSFIESTIEQAKTFVKEMKF